jgi:hypothetical protein
LRWPLISVLTQGSSSYDFTEQYVVQKTSRPSPETSDPPALDFYSAPLYCWDPHAPIPNLLPPILIVLYSTLTRSLTYLVPIRFSTDYPHSLYILILLHSFFLFLFFSFLSHVPHNDSSTTRYDSCADLSLLRLLTPTVTLIVGFHCI